MEAEIRVIQSGPSFQEPPPGELAQPSQGALLRELARPLQEAGTLPSREDAGRQAGLMRWSHMCIDGTDSKAQDPGRQALRKLASENKRFFP